MKSRGLIRSDDDQRAARELDKLRRLIGEHPPERHKYARNKFIERQGTLIFGRRKP
jgi:hypothetical protein